MNGNNILADTNILIYFLAGNTQIKSIFMDNEITVSFISELELLSFPGIKKQDEQIIQQMLNGCRVVAMSEEIKLRTIQLKRKYKLRLPDANVAATAWYLDIPLLTADKDFAPVSQINVILLET
jgi:hypothetical protein